MIIRVFFFHFFFSLLSLLFPLPSLFSLSGKKGGGNGEWGQQGGRGEGREALLIIDLQTCQRQSRPLWEKAKKAATLFPPFLSLLSGRERAKEVRALLTFLWQYHNRDWGSVFRRRTQTLEKNIKSFLRVISLGGGFPFPEYMRSTTFFSFLPLFVLTLRDA